MTRLVALVFRNWPLKLAAIVVATLLYAGIVLSQNVQSFPGTIPIVPVRQPTNAVIVGNLPSVSDIRFVAPTDVAARLTRDSFTASIDLGNAAPTATNPFVTVKVDLKVADDRVRILDYNPQVVQVRLDPLVSKVVPVAVDHGDVPTGFQVGEPVLSAEQATVSGPDSVVRLVTAARARVLIQPSGLDVDQDVPLVAVDALGNQVGPVDLEPAAVHVKILVGSQTTTKTVPVDPIVTGSPADGYEVAGIDVVPGVATLSGDADALAGLARVDTAAVSIAGSTRDVVATARLSPPDGISVVSTSDIRVAVHIRARSGSRSVPIGIELLNPRPDRTYDLSTDQVVLTLGGTVGALDRVDGSTLVATADVGSLTPGVHTVKLAIRAPVGTTLVSLAPASVTVTVAVAAPSPTPTVAPTASATAGP